jgi:hypothetical protein
MWWRVEVLIDAQEIEYSRKGHNLYLREQIDRVGRSLHPYSSITGTSGDSTWADFWAVHDDSCRLERDGAVSLQFGGSLSRRLSG